MSKNDVLGVGAAGSVVLASSAWLTGYWGNRLFAWIGLFATVVVASGIAWYSKNKNDTYQEIAKYAALCGTSIYIGASAIGLVATRWSHGNWNPELLNNMDGIITKLFSGFPTSFMKTILHPTFSTLIFGAILMGIWCALGSSFLPLPEQKKSASRKRGK